MSTPTHAQRTRDLGTPGYLEQYENLAFTRDDEGWLYRAFTPTVGRRSSPVGPIRTCQPSSSSSLATAPGQNSDKGI
jgi:hypothetical protein